MIDSNYIYERVMSLVEAHVGEENAITQRHLLDLLHFHCPELRPVIANTRSLLTVIHDMRNRGYVIASGQHGYFKPLNRSEAEKYVRRVLNSRAGDLERTKRAQLAAIKREYDRQPARQMEFDFPAKNAETFDA